MFEDVRQNRWRYIKLVFGGFLIFCAVRLLMPDSEFRIQLSELEAQGLPAVAKITDIDVKESTSYSSSSPPEAISALGPVGGFIGGFSGGMKLGRALSGDTSDSGSTATVTRSYAIVYTFTTADGQKVEDSRPISDEHLDHLTPGTEMKVLYHPANPRTHRLPEYSKPQPVASFFVRLRGATILSALGAFLMYRNWPAGNGGSGTPSPRPVPVESSGRVQRAVRTSPSSTPRPAQSSVAQSSTPRAPRAPTPSGRGISGANAGPRRGFGTR